MPAPSPIALPAEKTSTEEQRPFRFGDAIRFNADSIPALVTLGFCWVLFFDSLRGEWTINPQYNYGFVVPLLCAALFWRRWRERPLEAPAGHGALVEVTAGGLLLMLLPLRLILEANPEWRLLYWLEAFQALGLSACIFFWFGGWPWVRHFLPPLALALTAVPWPMQFEQSIIQGLMRVVATLTVSMADGLAIPAVQHGNVIEVAAGLVGIDEACSGVRSLQSALMLSLFLGELNRFKLVRRLLLLVASLLLVLLANVARTSFLVWLAATGGLSKMEAWHNTAGLFGMIIALSGLIALGWGLSPRNARRASSPVAAPRCLTKLPFGWGVTGLVWLVVVLIATELWYRAHEKQLAANISWSVAWPSQNPHFRWVSLPENSLAILRCSESESGAWTDDVGNSWSAFFLRWRPGKNSAELAIGHRPEICFPAAGAHLLQDFGRVNLNVAGRDIVFHHQSFQAGEKHLHVFYCLWADRGSVEMEPMGELSPTSRLRSALAGKRHLGQQVLEIVLQGSGTSEEAVALFQAQAHEMIKTKLPLLYSHGP
jgi:exosortase